MTEFLFLSELLL